MIQVNGRGRAPGHSGTDRATDHGSGRGSGRERGPGSERITERATDRCGRPVGSTARGQLTKTSPRAGRAATRGSDARPSARTEAGARAGGAVRRAGFEAVRTVVALAARGAPDRAGREAAGRAATGPVDTRASVDADDGADAGGMIGAAASVVVAARLGGAGFGNVDDPGLDGAVRASIVAEVDAVSTEAAAAGGATDEGAIGAGVVP